MAKGKKPDATTKNIRRTIKQNTQAAKANVRDAVAEAKYAAKEARRKQRAALAHSGMDIREFRSAVSALKRAGIVSKKTDARKQEATSYMRKRVRDFFGVVTGTEQAVPVPKKTRQEYKESGAVKMKGRFALIPKEDKAQIARVRKGYIEVTTPVGRARTDGSRPAFMREVILPFKMTQMHIVAERLRDDPTLDGLKEPNELFGARIYGHNMDQGHGWTDIQSLGDHILRNYQHLLSGRADKQAVRYFRLYRFWNNKSQLPEGPKSERDYLTDHRRKKMRKGERREKKFRGSVIDEMRNKKLAEKKRRDRDRETDAQREARLEKQRERSRLNRAKKKGKKDV